MAIRKMTMKDYQASGGISRSYLVNLLKSPKYAEWQQQNKEEPTRAMILGSALHTAVLEPELFGNDFVVIDIDRQTNAGKALDAKYKAENINVIKSEEMNQISGMSNAIRDHANANAMLKNGIAEQSIFWIDEETGIKLKCRPDYRCLNGIIPDIKTCLDASPEAFAKTVLNMDYHIQAAMYLDGLKANNLPAKVFIFIAVEKESPFQVAIYVLNEEFVDMGRVQYKKALRILKKCIIDSYYPGYSQDIVELTPPKWAFMEQTKEDFINE